MQLSATAIEVIALAAVGIGLVALIVAVVATVRVRSLTRDYLLLQGDDDADSFVTAVTKQIDEVTALRRDIAEQSAAVNRLADDLRDAIRHIAVVRYDAFGDMGGRYSFSVAMLDDSGDGLVLTAIHSRSDTRTYFKGVREGTGLEELSPEEVRAVALARGQED